MPKKILDIGCGRAKHDGAVGIDWRRGPDVDIVHDLNKFPWPIKDDTFDEVICQDTIQLLDNVVKTMEEIHRIAKPGAIVKIRTPHFSHPNSFRDPMHKWHFTIDTFDYFTIDFKYPIYTDKKYKMLRKEFIFNRSWGMGAILARFSPRRYERYSSHRFPPYNMYFELEVIKRQGCDIIIPVWNEKELTQQCVNSIFSNTHCDYSIIIVDNASGQPTREYLDRLWAEHPNKITLIRNDENLGNTKAANQGITVSKADYVCILDNDTLVTDGWLEEMIRIAECSEDIGIVNPFSDFDRKKPWYKSYQKFAKEMTVGRKNQYIETATAIGFCYLIKRECINKIGLWDERFSPGYFEDTEYSLRAKKAGYRSVFAKGAFVFHFEHTSFRKQNFNQLFEQSREKFYSLYKKPERVLFVKSHIDKKYYDKIIHTSYSLAKDANWVWIFLRKSSPELNLYEHTNIKVIRIPSVRFYLGAIMRILFKKKKFSTIFVDDENLAAILKRLKRYHSAEVHLLSEDAFAI